MRRARCRLATAGGDGDQRSESQRRDDTGGAVQLSVSVHRHSFAASAPDRHSKPEAQTPDRQPRAMATQSESTLHDGSAIVDIGSAVRVIRRRASGARTRPAVTPGDHVAVLGHAGAIGGTGDHGHVRAGRTPPVALRRARGPSRRDPTRGPDATRTPCPQQSARQSGRLSRSRTSTVPPSAGGGTSSREIDARRTESRLGSAFPTRCGAGRRLSGLRGARERSGSRQIIAVVRRSRTNLPSGVEAHLG
jgi:hypothetical protein